MSIEILYSIISFLITIIITLIALQYKSAGKREDKIVLSLEKLTSSLTDFKDNNVQAHKLIEDKVIKTEMKLKENLNTLDKRVTTIEGLQKSPLCPVVTKQLNT